MYKKINSAYKINKLALYKTANNKREKSTLLAMITILFLGVILAGCNTSGNTQKATSNRPNIVLIMSDDMGYSDIGCFGGEISTPNLDQLAKNGLLFTQFYNSGRCCPTRASLMTGLYPHQTGIGHMTNTQKHMTDHSLRLPAYQGQLNNTSVTMAEVLKTAGYTTLMSGKWHLGNNTENHPMKRGFDKFYGMVWGASSHFKPAYPWGGMSYMNDTISITDPDYYTTDVFTEHAISFINESRANDGEKPFFLYLAYTAPHWPMQAPKEEIDKYRGRYMDGWESIYNNRIAKMKKMELIDETWQIPTADYGPWDSLSVEKKTEMDLRRAIYSGMVDRMDQNIGKLLKHLKEKNILDNTLIIFLNDNGAFEEGGPLGGGPASQLETKEGFFLTYGRNWANSSNTPYREYKHWVHEGGISTPFIVHWPEKIAPKEQGNIIRQHAFLPDLMATFVDLSGANYPTEHKGETIPPMAGKSLLPLFTDNEITLHDEPIFWEHEGNKAVRLDNYKLVSKWQENTETSWELYDMKSDRTETHDLSAQMPEKVAEMSLMYDKWALKNKVRPWKEIKERTQKKRKELG